MARREAGHGIGPTPGAAALVGRPEGREHPTSLSNCSPSPCGRRSLPRTTTGTPPVHRASGSHSLSILVNLPQFTCRTRTYWLGCRSQSLPLLAASRCSPLGLATRFPRAPVRRLTYSTGIRGQQPYVCSAPDRMPPDKPYRWRRRFSPQTRDTCLPVLRRPLRFQLRLSPNYSS